MFMHCSVLQSSIPMARTTISSFTHKSKSNVVFTFNSRRLLYVLINSIATCYLLCVYQFLFVDLYFILLMLLWSLNVAPSLSITISEAKEGVWKYMTVTIIKDSRINIQKPFVHSVYCIQFFYHIFIWDTRISFSHLSKLFFVTCKI